MASENNNTNNNTNNENTNNSNNNTNNNDAGYQGFMEIVRKNKFVLILNCQDETSNVLIMEILNKHRMTNEIIELYFYGEPDFEPAKNYFDAHYGGLSADLPILFADGVFFGNKRFLVQMDCIDRLGPLLDEIYRSDNSQN